LLFMDTTLSSDESTVFEADYRTKLGNFWGASMIYDGDATYTLFQEADASIFKAVPVVEADPATTPVDSAPVDSAPDDSAPTDSGTFAMGAITAALTLVSAL